MEDYHFMMIAKWFVICPLLEVALHSPVDIIANFVTQTSNIFKLLHRKSDTMHASPTVALRNGMCVCVCVYSYLQQYVLVLLQQYVLVRVPNRSGGSGRN